MKITHWKCANCRKLKKLREEIARADQGAWCNACLQGRDTTPEAGSTTQEQYVYVHRRGFVRRHSTDNLD
jgi:hypothetical protein